MDNAITRHPTHPTHPTKPLTVKQAIQRTRREELVAAAMEYDEAMCAAHRRDKRTGRCRYCDMVMP